MEKPTIWIVALTLLFLPAASRAQQANTVPEPKLSAEQLDNLVGPIALYPDPMVAMILPASTVPSDVVLAARYLRDGKPADQIDNQNWDPSVKSLARYPDVINMMDENLEWTNQLGAAVIAQQEDVMQAIQTQRAKANQLGNLTTTPQQQVIVEKEIIQIVPADPQVIYVPQYNPQVVYVQSAPPAAPFITFGLGLAMGAWLTNDCDWHHHGFYVNSYPGGWHGYSRYGYNGGGNTVNINNSNNVNISGNGNNYWKPNPNRPQPNPPYNPNRPGNGGANTLPAYRPPPSGGWNGGNSGNKPDNGNNHPGGGNGSSKPGTGTGNGGANKPGNGGGNYRPGNGGQPGGGNGQNKPAPGKPSTMPSQPQNKFPGAGGQKNSFDRENSKRERPAQSQRPAQQPARQQQSAAPQRQAPQARQAAPQRPQPQRQAGGGGLQR